MNKKIAIIFTVLLISLLAGCDQIPQVKQLKDAYLQTRVAQLLTQMPTKEPKAAEPTAATVLPTVVFTETNAPTSVATTETPATPEPTAVPTFTPIPATAPVTETLTAVAPTPTVVSTDPAVYLGKPVWKDPFDENKGWAVDTDAFTSASIANGVMTLITKSTYDGWRLAPTGSLGNNYIEAVFTTPKCAANDHYGLMFRVPVMATADQGYQFGITCDGRYLLRKYDGKVGESGQMISLLPWKPHANINAGANQTNRIGIMTIDDRLIMFINGEMVGEFKDKTYPQGFIGLFLGSRDTKNFTIKVDDLAYWSNPKTP